MQREEREMMPGIALIERTSQLWKLRLGMAGALLGTAVRIGASEFDGLASGHSMALGFGGLFVALAGVVYLCIAVRCPDCGARWFWLMASKPSGDPTHWSMSSQACTAIHFTVT